MTETDEFYSTLDGLVRRTQTMTSIDKEYFVKHIDESTNKSVEWFIDLFTDTKEAMTESLYR